MWELKEKKKKKAHNEPEEMHTLFAVGGFEGCR
jgi:hypothetical protein